MKKTVFIFGSLILALLLLFQISKYALLRGDLRAEIILAVVALVFFGIGLNFQRKNENIDRKAGKIDREKIEKLQLSNREYEVLCEISNGLSNKEIGEKLHLSENTIKSHVSNILLKLDAKRRTQAILIAKNLKIIN